MKYLKIITFLFATLLMVSSCKKNFEDYSQNRNLPLQVPPGLILPTILNDMVAYPGGDEDKYSQYIVSNYNYYGDNKYWNGSTNLNYGTLRNVLALDKQANKLAGSENNPYHVLSLFFRSFFFVNMTAKVGDLPMNEALQGLDNVTPKYNTQKEIFKQALQWLDTANTLLGKQIPLVDINDAYYEFSGDIYYKARVGSNSAALKLWQKAVNSYRLRVLIELSKKADDIDLNIKQQFAKIYNDPTTYPIFTNTGDNLQYNYNSSYNYYPDNQTNYGNNAGRLNIAATLETNLGKWHDLRAMVFGEPARGLGFSDTSFNSFVGGKSGDDVSNLSTLSGAGSITLYNYNHYYSGYTAEPTLILSYPEVCYCVAEAANRGWITADAEAWYKKGTIAMYEFYGLKDGLNQVFFIQANGNGGITYNVPFSFDAYFNQPLVKYKGNNADGLAQILTEKYFAYARNSGLQGYFQWRRTGVPEFSIGAGSGNGGKLPRRFQYPNNEKSTNAANVTEAIKNQFGGSDDIFVDLWLVK